MRTGLFGATLAARGHDVTWWSSSFDHTSKTRICDGECKVVLGTRYMVRTMKSPAYRRNVSVARYASLRAVARRFTRLAPEAPRPDAIVASYPDHHLAYEATRFARRARVPVVVDVRDAWPDWFLDLVPPALRPLARLVLADDFRRSRACLSSADSILAVTDGQLSWALERAGRVRSPLDRVFPLGAPRLAASSMNLRPSVRELIDRLAGKRVVLFVGSFGSSWNPAVLARAAHLVPYDVVIAGDGERREEVELAARGATNVSLPGWLTNDEIAALLRVGSIGVIPLSNGLERAPIIPNKTFTYLSGGLPIVSSARGELEEFLRANGIGVTFDANDPRSLAAALRGVAEDAPALRAMGERARAVFEARFDAGNISDAMVEHLERVVEERRR